VVPPDSEKERHTFMVLDGIQTLPTPSLNIGADHINEEDRHGEKQKLKKTLDFRLLKL
jgi:hypothetical protein